MPIFGQVWLWSSLAFLLGALLCWLLVARPARNRVGELEAQLTNRSRRPSGAERPEPVRPVEDSLAPGLNGRDDPARSYVRLDTPPPLPPERGRLAPYMDQEPSREYEPLPKEPVSFNGGGLSAPPEVPDTELAGQPSSAATQYLDVSSGSLSAPPEVPAMSPPPSDRGWFDDELEGDAANQGPEEQAAVPRNRHHLVEPDPMEPFDARLVDDVDEDTSISRALDAPEGDAPRSAIEDESGGTVFTQRTHPIPGELIRQIDEAGKEERARAEAATSPDSLMNDLVDDFDEDETDRRDRTVEAEAVTPPSAFTEPEPSGSRFTEPESSGRRFTEPESSGRGFAEPESSGSRFAEPESSGRRFAESEASGGGFAEPESGRRFAEPEPSGGGFAEPESSGRRFAESESSSSGFAESESSGRRFDGSEPSGDVAEPASSGGFAEPETSGRRFAGAEPSGHGFAEPESSGGGFGEPESPGRRFAESEPSGSGFGEREPAGRGFAEPESSSGGFAEPAPAGRGFTEPEPAFTEPEPAAARVEPEQRQEQTEVVSSVPEVEEKPATRTANNLPKRVPQQNRISQAVSVRVEPTPNALPKRVPSKPRHQIPFGVQPSSTPEPAPTATADAPPEPQRSLFEPIVPAEDEGMATPPPPHRLRQGSGGGRGPFGPGSAMPLPGGASPSPEFTIKASVAALRYCTPESPQFGRTVAEVWFRTAADAERVGFRPVG